jgi:hypothetical protein
MKRHLFKALAVLGFAGASVFAVANPASAHNFDTNSYFYCSAHRTFGYDLLLHSWPIHIDPHTVIYACKASNPNTGTYTYDVWLSLDDGTNVATHYQDCTLGCQDVP